MRVHCHLCWLHTHTPPVRTPPHPQRSRQPHTDNAPLVPQEHHVADLSEDITKLCEARGSSMWSSSYILTERYNTLQTELRMLRGRSGTLTTERDALLAEAGRLREGAARAAAERGALDARVETLQSELGFFQTSASTALHERDEAVFQGRELRQQVRCGRPHTVAKTKLPFLLTAGIVQGPQQSSCAA
jgi:hypothetical protein